MPAYLLLLAALLIRPGILPHSGWLQFSAIGGALLYFGAKRGAHLWEMLLPVAALGAADYYLTVQVYSYPFVWQAYLVTWAWYVAAIVLGRILLARHISILRVASAALLGPTSFYLASNYGVWADSHQAGGMYAPTLNGLVTCYIAGLPFYERDLLSTGIVLTLAFGIPAMVRRFQENRELATHQTL